MDPSSTDPNNPNPFNPPTPVEPGTVSGQPDLSSATLTANPAGSTNNDSIWTPPSTAAPTDMNTSDPISPAASSLDNPFNVPTQPPTIDGGLPPAPLDANYPNNPAQPIDMNTDPITPQPDTNTLNSTQLDTQTLGMQSQTNTLSQPDVPSWQPPTPTNPEPAPNQPEAVAPTPPPDPAPTDLSHLIPDSANSQPGQPALNEATNPVYTPPITQPETLIVPSNGNEVGPNIPTENSHSKIPKWVIGLGIGLLIAVSGASAYFILGVGQNVTTPSLPAEEQTEQQLSTPPTIAPTAPVITPTSTLPGNGSGFENLDSSGPTPPQASSAADILRDRQRQQQGL